MQQEIMEADEEWAQNKKLIDTTGKGLRKSVPKVRKVTTHKECTGSVSCDSLV